MKTIICDRCKKDLYNPMKEPRIMRVSFFKDWFAETVGWESQWDLCEDCFAVFKSYFTVDSTK